MTKQLAPSADFVDAELPTFDVLPLSKEVRRAVDELGFTHPTPVQKAVFETAASGRDVVVQARTGTGKTAAFGLPIIDRLVDVALRQAQVLVLSPTRELALQINRELDNLAKYKGVECTAVYGGASMQPQIDAIKRGTQVIAGTPGRVLDHLERGTLDPKRITTLVLDESDEMLSMGFLPQITRIMEQLPKKRQTLLFSATLPSDVRRIAETRLTDPEFITLSGDHIGALSIDHVIYRSSGNKADELVQILEIENPESAIIFCNTRDQTKRLSGALNRKGFASDWLNADLAQNDREKVMKATRESKLRFLVCTDVAARGIDISHLTHVINADFPESTETYVHRTGRTGRAGKTGTAISIVTPQDTGNLYMLRLTYKIFPTERELPSAGDLQTRKEADLVAFLDQSFSGGSILPGDRSLARRILTSDVAETIVAGLLGDHFGRHPNAGDDASDARRAKNPPPVEDEAPKKKDKDKKDKKKGDKDRKKDRVHRSESPREDEVVRKESSPTLSRREESDKPQKLKQGEFTSSDATKPQAVERTVKINPKTEKFSAKSGEPGAGLETISAASLLSADDRALLDGEQSGKDEKRSAYTKSKRDDRPRDPVKDKRPEAAPKLKAQGAEDDEVGRIFVDAGKRDEVFKDDFIATLVAGGFDPSKVAFVNVRDTHTFIGVEPLALDDAVKALDGKEVGGLEVSAEKARPRRA